MELLFLLAVLATAYVLAQALFGRKAREPEASGLSTKTQKPPEPPLVETTELDMGFWFEQSKQGKTYGEIFGTMFPQTLVDGKQCWQILDENPDNKHDLDLMLACCKAQMEEAAIEQISFPAPAYFKRVAIILRKQKDYEREIGIIELYLSLGERVLENRQKLPKERTKHLPGMPQKGDFEERLVKAKLLLEKQRAKKAQK